MQGAPNRKSNGTTKQWFTQWTTENQQNIPSAESTVLTQSRALYVTLHHFWFAHSSQKQHKTLHLGNYPHNCYFTFSLVKRYFRSGRTLVQERQWWSRWPRQQALPPWRPTKCKASSSWLPWSPSSSPSSPSSIQSSPSRHLCAQHGWVASPLCKNVSNVEQSWPWTIIWKRGSLYDSKHKVRFIQEVAAVIISLKRFDLVVHLHLENWPDLQWLHRSKI